jgi:hypothetical protein
MSHEETSPRWLIGLVQIVNCLGARERKVKDNLARKKKIDTFALQLVSTFAGAASTARSFTLNFGDGESTGISLVESEVKGNDAIYDLQGRRVVNTNKKGLFIQNGNKVVIK